MYTTSNYSIRLLEYLTAVFYLSREKRQNVRGVDMSRYLSVSRAAVSGKVRLLTRYGLVSHQSYGTVKLTKKGLVVLKDFVMTQRMWYEFFVDILGVQSSQAVKAVSSMYKFPKAVEQRFIAFLTSKRGIIYENNCSCMTLSGSSVAESLCRFCKMQIKRIKS